MKPSDTRNAALVIAMLMTGTGAHASRSVASAWSGTIPHALIPHVIPAQQSQGDTDIARMLLRIEYGKGGRCRSNTILSEDLLILLRQWWKIGWRQGVM